MCLSLFGQGERYRVDPRFRSPEATVLTYWEALGSDDGTVVAECFDDPANVEPVPGSLWFLPPSRTLGVYALRIQPLDDHRVIATYEVRCRMSPAQPQERFIIASELVQVRGEWFMAEPIDGFDTPEWRSIPRPVDI